jgi:hypothetical protein
MPCAAAASRNQLFPVRNLELDRCAGCGASRQRGGAPRSLKPAFSREQWLQAAVLGGRRRGGDGAVAEPVVGDNLHACRVLREGHYLKVCRFQGRDATTGHHAASLVEECGGILVVARVLVITMTLVPWLLVAVGRSLFAHRHTVVVGHGSHRGIRHDPTYPTEEEANEHSCQKADEAHACR